MTTASWRLPIGFRLPSSFSTERAVRLERCSSARTGGRFQMRSFAALFLLAVAVPLSGCTESLSPAPASGQLLRTGGAAYTLAPTTYGWQVDIPYEFENRTGGAVYLANCGGFVPPDLERKVDGQWRTEWGAVEDSCGSPPVVIQAGEVFRDTLQVTA